MNFDFENVRIFILGVFRIFKVANLRFRITLKNKVPFEILAMFKFKTHACSKAVEALEVKKVSIQTSDVEKCDFRQSSLGPHGGSELDRRPCAAFFP